MDIAIIKIYGMGSAECELYLLNEQGKITFIIITDLSFMS